MKDCLIRDLRGSETQLRKSYAGKAVKAGRAYNFVAIIRSRFGFSNKKQQWSRQLVTEHGRAKKPGKLELKPNFKQTWRINQRSWGSFSAQRDSSNHSAVSSTRPEARFSQLRAYLQAMVWYQGFRQV